MLTFKMPNPLSNRLPVQINATNPQNHRAYRERERERETRTHAHKHTACCTIKNQMISRAK